MSDGAAFTFLPLGAIIQTFNVGGRNIVQGFDTQEQYVEYNKPFFGETIGRIANRVKGAQLDDIASKAWPLVKNDGANSLHGGNDGWGKRIWKGPEPVGIKSIPGVDGLEGGESVEFTLVSKHGDEGYPGTVEAKITYTTGTQAVPGAKEPAVVLAMDYEARLAEDSEADETAISMTNHSYFNIADGETIDGTVMKLPTSNHLPVDSGAIPTGGPIPWPHMKLHEPFTHSATGPNIDHCFTLAEDPSAVPLDTRSQPLAINVEASHPKTGITLQVLSTEPAFQIYTGHGINVPAVDSLPARKDRCAFCCEPSRWVNAVNVPEWKSQVTLKKGDTYGCRIVYKAWTS